MKALLSLETSESVDQNPTHQESPETTFPLPTKILYAIRAILSVHLVVHDVILIPCDEEYKQCAIHCYVCRKARCLLRHFPFYGLKQLQFSP